MKIFGREPAALVGVLQAVLLFAGLQLGWSGAQIGALAIVIVAVGDTFVAVVTHDTLLGVAVGLVKAVVAAMLAFGIDLDAAHVAAFTALVTSVIGFFQRTQTFPTYAPPVPLPGATPVSDVGAA